MREDYRAEVNAVERAVREGRTTWPMVISGRADRLPEVVELYRAGVQHLLNALGEEPADPAPPKPVSPLDDWDEHGPPETFMRRGW
jgi:hypothetical protein